MAPRKRTPANQAPPAARVDYFKVMAPNLFFPQDFEVIQRTERLLRLKNTFETYWVTRTRFDASQGTVFRTATVKEHQR